MAVPFLRIASLIAVTAGAVGSVGFVLYAGRQNPSRILMLLFVLWVLSPFVALSGAMAVSKRWPVLTQTVLYCMALLITFTSLAIYGEVALGPRRAQTAFVFIVAPPASWLVTAVVMALAAFVSRRLAAKNRASLSK